jgi:hypothetical protein
MPQIIGLFAVTYPIVALVVDVAFAELRYRRFRRECANLERIWRAADAARLAEVRAQQAEMLRADLAALNFDDATIIPARAYHYDTNDFSRYVKSQRKLKVVK